MRGYQEGGGRNRLGCFLASLWLLIALPLFFILLLSGGGCEGAPSPCTPKRWPEFAFIAAVIGLGVSTAWATRQLHSADRNALWWLALGVAFALVGLAVFLGWALASAFVS
jgi:hypothetical protein